MEESINKLLEIGNKGKCTEQELYYFLPNYPTLRGSEYVFTANGWERLSHNNFQIENFVKGLHYVELKYREMTNDDFGFGSPSRTHQIISRLEKTHPELALTLSKWIADNGGNYYIKATELFKIKREGLFGEIIE
jgi:hypothetical protein